MNNNPFITRPGSGKNVHPLYEKPLADIVNIYGQMTDRGFDEEALIVPRDRDIPGDFVLYLEFNREGDSISVSFDKLDPTLTPEEVADFLTKTATFLTSSLNLLIFSGKGHYQDVVP